MILTAKQFIADLSAFQTRSDPENTQRFFADKTVANKFLGVRMATVFALAKRYLDLPGREIEKLLQSDHYEARVGAVSIMDFKARNKKTSSLEKKKLFNIYIKNHQRINNWDMVDRSAPYVIGGYLYDKPRTILYKLAKSKNIWERRTSIVATYYFIRQNDVDDTFKIAELLVHDKEDLVNKAVGSWVREAGKRDRQKLIAFLDKYAATMPRVTLRYAIEKLNQKEKAFYMKKAG
jgi:3-methyladenine DNA glycosylase AlkD